MRDTSLSNKSTELWASRQAENFKQNRMLSQKKSRKYQHDVFDMPWFASKSDFVFCNDVQGLLLKIGDIKIYAERMALVHG